MMHPMGVTRVDYRANGRETRFTFRMSREERKDLNEKAALAGCKSVQEYLEFLVWERRSAPRGPGPSSQQELPLTG